MAIHDESESEYSKMGDSKSKFWRTTLIVANALELVVGLLLIVFAIVGAQSSEHGLYVVIAFIGVACGSIGVLGLLGTLMSKQFSGLLYLYFVITTVCTIFIAMMAIFVMTNKSFLESTMKDRVSDFLEDGGYSNLPEDFKGRIGSQEDYDEHCPDDLLTDECWSWMYEAISSSSLLYISGSLVLFMVLMLFVGLVASFMHLGMSSIAIKTQFITDVIFCVCGLVLVIAGSVASAVISSTSGTYCGIVLLLLGLLLLGTSIVGCCAVWKKNSKFYTVHIVLLAILAALLWAGGISMFLIGQQVIDDLEGCDECRNEYLVSVGELSQQYCETAELLQDTTTSTFTTTESTESTDSTRRLLDATTTTTTTSTSTSTSSMDECAETIADVVDWDAFIETMHSGVRFMAFITIGMAVFLTSQVACSSYVKVKHPETFETMYGSLDES